MAAQADDDSEEDGGAPEGELPSAGDEDQDEDLDPEDGAGGAGGGEGVFV